MLPDASISFDNTSGKSVASDSVGLVVSPSSCSFLLMVEASCDHEDIICPLPLMSNIIELCVLIMDN